LKKFATSKVVSPMTNQAAITHETLCDSEGPVLFVRTGVDHQHVPIIVVCFSRIIVVWSVDLNNSSKWHCLAVGETSPTFSYATTIVDCIVIPPSASEISGAIFGMITFQSSGDSKRHILFDDKAFTIESQEEVKEGNNNIDNNQEECNTPTPTPPSPLPMSNEIFRPHDRNTTTTAACVCGENKLITGTSNGQVKCWEMTSAWDRVMKVYSFKIPPKKKVGQTKKKDKMESRNSKAATSRRRGTKQKQKNNRKRRKGTNGSVYDSGSEEEEEIEEVEDLVEERKNEKKKKEEEEREWSVVTIDTICDCENKPETFQKRRSKRGIIKTDFLGRPSLTDDIALNTAINASLDFNSPTQQIIMEPKYIAVGLSSCYRRVGSKEYINRVVCFCCLHILVMVMPMFL
jgi:hypothetical protein